MISLIEILIDVRICLMMEDQTVGLSWWDECSIVAPFARASEPVKSPFLIPSPSLFWLHMVSKSEECVAGHNACVIQLNCIE
ncbi:Uncharacterized protein HZ326_10280 [Fusarium oxysporum f. sp. albedinis]|nr:Uncharacterized protein HZ326_10280 [Fusarium oxysporum f. sp. albedinis]